MTKVQQAVIDILAESGRHMTAEEVYLKLKERFSSLALGTVYRNLNKFADAKLIRRVSRAHMSACFEANVSAHDHSVCVKCGEMSDLSIPPLKDFLKKQMLCEIIGFDLTVDCICKKCAQKSI